MNMVILNPIELDHEAPRETNANASDSSIMPKQADHITRSSHCTKSVKFLMIQAFIICYYCMCISVIIKKPLSVTKAALHNDLNLTTVQLSHIDGFFLISRAIGQLVIPFLAAEFCWRRFLFNCYIIISMTLFIFPFFSSFYQFIFLYSIVGFSSSYFYPIIMNNLVTWLPKKLLVKLLLFWVTSHNFGK